MNQFVESGDDPVTLWIEQLRAQDEVAAERLWHHFVSRLVELARSQLNPKTRRVYDEEDAALSAFNSVCQSVRAGRLTELRDRGSLLALLLRVTTLKVAQRHRFDLRQRRDVRRNLSDSVFARGETAAPFAEPSHSREPSPQFAAEFVDTCATLIQRLNDPSLERVVQLRMEGYSDSEIGRQLDCSRRTVQRRLEAIRRQCDKLLL